MDEWHYDDADLERLSMIMTLHYIRFGNSAVERYIRLLMESSSTEGERMHMLEKRKDCKRYVRTSTCRLGKCHLR